jgi:hypothetical protein
MERASGQETVHQVNATLRLANLYRLKAVLGGLMHDRSGQIRDKIVTSSKLS